jgi:Uma2 family endonuclease
MTHWQKLDVPRRVKLTIADYRLLDNAGVFSEYGKTELIDGEIVAMNAQFTRHARFKSELFRRLANSVEASMPGFCTLVEPSVAIPPHNMPEPDIVVTSFLENVRDPVPIGTVALIVEVSDSTLKFDLGKKARIYATAGVPEYWVADLENSIFYLHSNPGPKFYGKPLEAVIGGKVKSVTIPNLAVDTAGL